jgi:hypothetical protein
MQPLVHDLSTFERRYIVKCSGHCMTPLVPDGTPALADTTAKLAAGDLALIYFRPELVKPGEFQASLKRLVLASPPFVRFPFKDHPESNVRAVIIAEMLNPPRRFVIRCDNLLGIHRAQLLPEDATYDFQRRVWHIPSIERELQTAKVPASGGAL